MSVIADPAQLGALPLRDHREIVNLELRTCVLGMRVKKRDELQRRVATDWGDLQCFSHWPVASDNAGATGIRGLQARPFGSWANAFPAVVGGGSTPPSGAAGSSVGQTAIRGEGSDRLRPVRKFTLEADNRYADGDGY